MAAEAGVRGNASLEESLIYTVISSPIGALTAARNDRGAIAEIRFGERPDVRWLRNDRRFADVRKQLDAYFAGSLTTFDLALAPEGTPFQQCVWQALRGVPYGQTRTYAEIAREIGRPTAFRAVGAANGANPIPLVIPCHRVIGSDGSLTGFGGGLDIKRRLLAHEATSALPLFRR